MSNPVIVTEGLTSTQASRKRGSPSTVTLKREGVNTASVAVGSSSSKFRRILNNTAQSGEETSTSQEQEGGFNTPGPSTAVVDSTGRVGSSRHSRQSRLKELRYLTDFFPDQEPSDRRLTRSQRQLSAPTSPATNSPEVGCSSNSSSAPSSLPQSNSGKERTARGRKGRGAGKLTDLNEPNTEGDSQPGPSSSRSRVINPAATGVCSSSARCEGTSNRVFPSGPSTSIVRQQQDLDFRISSQNAIVSQVSETPHFRSLSGEGVIQVASSARSTTDPALDNSTVSSIAAYNLSADTHHDHGIPLRAQATHTASTFLGTLIPRVHHLLGASHSHPNVRVVAIMDGLRSPNEIRQSEAASNLAEMLLLGNEESLPNLPLKDIVGALMSLLQKEHNFELMLTAARCISNMLEALPRALPIVIDAVPLLLEKLKRIECIDVAEQSLMALEVMSKRNGKNIMLAGGIAATISHVDFFSVPSQRLAFQVAANCASFVSASEFAHVRDSLPDLTQRLFIEDKRCLESICSLFCRLVDNLRNNADKLREVAGQNYALLKNVQHLLLMQPCPVGPTTFQSLIRMLRFMAQKCSDIAVALINMDFARAIRFLIVGPEEEETSLEVVNRPSQQLQELVFLAGELLPLLPSEGLFEIDSIMIRSHPTLYEPPQVQWYWKDDLHQWQPFSSFDSRIIEAAQMGNESEISLQIDGNVYRIDLQRMVQQNHHTGNERAIQRKNTPVVPKSKTTVVEDDCRSELLKTKPSAIEDVVKLLFPILVEIDGSSSGPALRYESLRVMLRMIYPSQSSLLKDVLSDLPVAGHIASALASPRSKDLCIVASALQLVHLILDKLPELYAPLFKREGVAHEVEKLAKIKLESPNALGPVRLSPSVLTDAKESGPTTIKTRSLKSRSGNSSNDEHAGGKQANSHARNYAQIPSTSEIATTSNEGARVIVSPSGGKHRRKRSPESPISKKESRRKSSSSNFLHSIRIPSFRMPSALSSHPPNDNDGANSTPISSFFSSLSSANNTSFIPSSSAAASNAPSTSHSTVSARPRLPFPYVVGSSQLAASYSSILMHSSATTHSGIPIPISTSASSSHVSALSHQQKEKVRQWIRKEAEYLMETCLSCPNIGNDSLAASTIIRMSAVASALTGEKDVGCAPLNEIKSIILENDVSAFELSHSGVLSALTFYLTSVGNDIQPTRKLRLKRFCAIFMSLNADNLRPADESKCWVAFEALILKLLASVAQLEQFQVKVTDMAAVVSGSSANALRGAQALRFFQTHQIRCNLRRHPSCHELKEWRRGHGSIKVDPFTSISAIEKYLLDRGVGYVRSDESSGDDNDSEDDEMPSEGSVNTQQSGQQRRIDIIINEEKIPGHMSILQAIRQYSPSMMAENSDQLSIATGLWMNTHTLYYKAASSPPSPEVTNEQLVPLKQGGTKSDRKERRSRIDEHLWLEGQIPKFDCPLDPYLTGSLPVEIEDPSAPSLVLLRALYGLNRYWWCLFDDEDVPPSSHAPLLPSTTFHSCKLNAKLGRQLSDFLSVATQQVPKWASDLVEAVPFIFTFPSRRNLLYCTAFGRDRALMHLVNQADGGHSDGESGRLTPRLERRKVSVRREDLLRQAEQALNRLGTSRAMLEVGFEGEAGTGFGPTLEFYSTVSREIQRASLKLWNGSLIVAQENNEGACIEYTHAEAGLYPVAHASQNAKQRDARLRKFEFIGRLLAQALIDARMLDIPFNPVFFKWFCGEDHSFGLADLEVLDKDLYHSLRALVTSTEDEIDSLDQGFTLPGDDNFELIKGGKHRIVKKTNVLQYVKLVSHWKLVEGVRREMEAVKRGFETIINIHVLSCFTPEEVEELFCGCSESNWSRTWNESVLQSCIKPDHGYSHDSDQIHWLIRMLSEYDREKQRKFLQFVTGSPKLPVGGFRSLNPPLTVVKKSGSYSDNDAELPSAMTCYNYLKIPAYSSYEVFKQRFDVALRFIYSFHLT